WSPAASGSSRLGCPLARPRRSPPCTARSRRRSPRAARRTPASTPPCITTGRSRRSSGPRRPASARRSPRTIRPEGLSHEDPYHRGQRIHRVPRRGRLPRRRARRLGAAPPPRRPAGAPLPARGHRIAGDVAEPGSLSTAAAGYDRVIHAGAPSDDHTDAAGAEALLASGSPLLYTTGAAVLGAGAQDEDSAADPH